MTSLDLNDLFLRGLKDICHAEKRVLKSLPKMAKAATSVRLRAAFEKHHEETEVQIERLEQILDLLGKHGRGKRCDSIKGLLNGLKDLEADYGGTIALDAGLVAA